jgi:outer membrane protein
MGGLIDDEWRKSTGSRALAAGALLVALAAPARAASDPFIDVLPEGGAGVGYLLRWERSAYKGAPPGADNLPLYLYEGERAYLHGTRAGLKFKRDEWRFDAFLAYRLEGFTRDHRPAGTTGEPREPGFDAGIALRRNTSWGTPYVEAVHDISNRSDGNELRAGYWNEWRRGRLTLRPHLVLAWRDSRLNRYYYEAGGGVDAKAELYAAYALDESWRILAGIGATRRSSAITSSVLAQRGLQTEGFVGFLYDFSPKQDRWKPESRPLIVKALYGFSSDCDMLQIMRLSCTSTHTVDNTDIAALHVGRKLIERAGGMPVDLAGFIGVQRHFEKTFQDDFWSVMAFFKAYWTSFPWNRYVRTRFGMGAGLSYSEHIGAMEARDQAKGNLGTWKLLNYLDPSIDFGVARDTWVGVGVSHRSGAFGRAQFFGNVDGGSNYIYLSVETTF